MKNILVRQIIIIPILYVVAKLLWDHILAGILPDVVKGVMSDLLGPSFIMVIVLWGFIYFLWRIPFLGKLTHLLFGTKPNIQGTWKGKLNYEWDGKESEKTVFLVIRQTDGYSLNIRLLTNERISSSKFADIIPNDSIQRIIYTYANEESPDNKEKNPSHEGFCQLDKDDSSHSLQGIYYTSRKTFGKLFFDRRKRKLVMNYKEAQKLFGIIEN